MSPFEPRGEVARWRVIYELLQAKQPKEILTYREMGEALGLNPEVQQERVIMQLAMRRAAKEFETIDKFAVSSVQNVGYRVVEAEEHLGLARTHQRKARKSVQRARSKVDNVDLNRIKDPVARQALETAALVLAQQAGMMRQMDIRQSALESAFDRVTERTEQQRRQTEDELESMRRRLERLEGRT